LKGVIMNLSVETILNKYNMIFELIEEGHYKITSSDRVDIDKLMYEVRGYTVVFEDVPSQDGKYKVYAILSKKLEAQKRHNLMLGYSKEYVNACVISAPILAEDSIDTVFERGEIYAD